MGNVTYFSIFRFYPTHSGLQLSIYIYSAESMLRRLNTTDKKKIKIVCYCPALLKVKPWSGNTCSQCFLYCLVTGEKKEICCVKNMLRGVKRTVSKNDKLALGVHRMRHIKSIFSPNIFKYLSSDNQIYCIITITNSNYSVHCLTNKLNIDL